MSLWRESLESWLKTIDVKADSVLDVGGGAKPVEGRTKSWDVNKYQIWDNENETAVKVDEYFDLSLLGPLRDEKFDITFCLEVLEYVRNPLIAMQNLERLTKKYVYISMPGLMYPEHKPAGTDLLRYTRSGVEKFVSKYFDIIEAKEVEVDMGDYTLLKSIYKNQGFHVYRSHSVGHLIKAKPKKYEDFTGR